jgi:hypothetical protein
MPSPEQNMNAIRPFSTRIRNRSAIAGLPGDWEVERLAGAFGGERLRVSSPDGLVHWISMQIVDGRLVGAAHIQGADTHFATRVGTNGELLPRIVDASKGGPYETRFPHDRRHIDQRTGQPFLITCSVDSDEGPVLTANDLSDGSQIMRIALEIRGNVLRTAFSRSVSSDPILVSFCDDGIAVSDPAGHCDGLLSARGYVPLMHAVVDSRAPQTQASMQASLSSGFLMELGEDLQAGADADIWFDAAEPGDEKARELIDNTQNAMTSAARTLLELKTLADELFAGLAASATPDAPETQALLERASQMLGLTMPEDVPHGPRF